MVDVDIVTKRIDVEMSHLSRLEDFAFLDPLPFLLLLVQLISTLLHLNFDAFLCPLELLLRNRKYLVFCPIVFLDFDRWARIYLLLNHRHHADGFLQCRVDELGAKF